MSPKPAAGCPKPDVDLDSWSFSAQVPENSEMYYIPVLMQEVRYLWGENLFCFWKLESVKQSTQCPKDTSVCSQVFENRAPICIWKAFILSAVITNNNLLFALKGMHWMSEFIECIKTYCQKLFTWIYYIFFSSHNYFPVSIHSWFLTFIEGLKWPLGWESKHELSILLYVKGVLH